MRKFIFILFSIFISTFSFGQLSDGVIAPNWTLTDINSNTHTLYDYLDQGKTVVIDVSATWCYPCWNYHNSHALRDVYNNYGPNGTDEMMVFFIEGDNSTTLDDLNGTGSNTYGDWVTGTPYPIINSTAINGTYHIGYFPTIYMICPDRVIKEIGQLSANDIYIEAQQCPTLTTTTDDVKLFELESPIGSYCEIGSVTPALTIQNYGTNQLTSIDIVSIIDGTPVDTTNWTGSLSMYDDEYISLPQSPILLDGNHSFEGLLINPNGNPDPDPSNNSSTNSFFTNTIGTIVKVKVKTDDYPEQTSWEVLLNGNVVESGGNYTQSNYIYITEACLIEDSCYSYIVYDSGNNGLEAPSFGLIYWNGQTITSFGAADFNGSQIQRDFCLNTSQITTIQEKSNINIYPNPAKNILNINSDNIISRIEIINIIGSKIMFVNNINKENLIINIENLNAGIYNILIYTDKAIVSKKIILY